MITHRRVLRTSLALAGSGGLAGIFVVALGGPALADTPAAWDPQPHVSALEYLLVLLLIPLGLALVISVLTLVPSLARDRGYEPGQAWRGESEWFGGPQKGVAAADEVSPDALESGEKDTGGGSGRW